MTYTKIHPVRLHVPEQKFRAGNYVWKCRNCEATLPDDKYIPERGPILCRVCQGVMDLTPIRRVVES